MNLLFRFSINLFPSILLLLLLFCGMLGNDRSKEAKTLNYTIIMMFFTLTFETISEYGFNSLNNGTALCYCVNYLYFVFAAFTMCFWTAFVCYTVFGNEPQKKRRKKSRIMMTIPVIYQLVIIFVPFTGKLYHIEEIAGINTYKRGPLFLLPYVFTIVISIFDAAISHVQKTKKVNQEKKTIFNALVLLSIAPIIAGVISIFSFNWRLHWPLATVSIMSVFVIVQNNKMTLDSLTEFNNRSELLRYLNTKVSMIPTPTFGIMIIDVNQFKKINDTFGHIIGDEALCHTAEILRECFNGEGVFLSRCGGDEFAVVIDDIMDNDAKEFRKKLYRIAADYSKRNCLPYTLSLSVGFSTTQSCKNSDSNTMYSEADIDMYKEKQRFHAMRE